MKTRTQRISLAVGGALLAGGLLVGTSLAQTPTAPGPGLGPGGGMMGAGPGAGFGFGGQMDDVAEALGLSTAELWQAHHVGGKSLGQLADERGVDRETVVQAMQGEHRERLDAMVAAGRLTQAQADAWLAAMEPHVRAMLDIAPGGFGPGMMGFGPGMMGGPRGPVGPRNGTGPMGPGSGFSPRMAPTSTP
jgi:hypothetical protein